MKIMYPLSTATELTAAYRKLYQGLRKAADGRHTKTVGWPGGSNRYDKVYSCSKHGFWFVYDDETSASDLRHWCAYGCESIDLPVLSVTVEINPPAKGIYRRAAGLFLKDSSGKIYLAHSGKIGGGKKGVGKNAFMKSYKGERVTVEWGNEQSVALLISELDLRVLGQNVGSFIREVRQFKDAVGEPAQPTKAEIDTASFNPEFSGSYVATINKSVSVTKLHGNVINSLSDRLKDMGYRVSNDRHRDLLVGGRGKSVKVLFEAKTGVGLTDIYTGVGQLLIHASVKPKPRKLILVLPTMPKNATMRALDMLGIEVLLYSVHGQDVIFKNLEIIK